MTNKSLRKFSQLIEETHSFFGRSLFRLGKDMIGGYLRYSFYHPNPPLPQFAVVFTTTYCDARCIMCNIWKPSEKKKTELTPDQFQQILADPLFREIDYLHLDGGEPTLRNDLAELADKALDVLPKVSKVSIVDNGLKTDQVVKSLMKLQEVCHKHGSHFSVTISLHGMEVSLADVRRVPHSFERGTETIKQLKNLQKTHDFYLSINSVITPRNLYDAPRVYEWCNNQAVPVRFVVNEVRERFQNTDLMENMTFSSEQKKYLLDFLMKLANEKSILNYEAYRYSKLIDVLKGKDRDLACRYDLGGILLGANAELYYCSHSKEIGNCLNNSPSTIYYDPNNVQYRKQLLLEKECNHCLPYASQEAEFYKEWPRYLGFLLSRNYKR
jgi:MoaA/NifB/PqqE/SkfB family radical SAM enzyme